MNLRPIREKVIVKRKRENLSDIIILPKQGEETLEAEVVYGDDEFPTGTRIVCDIYAGEQMHVDEDLLCVQTKNIAAVIA